MKIRYCFILFSFSLTLLAQSIEKPNAQENYNLPPGSVLKQKADEYVDYSYKIKQSYKKNSEKMTSLAFLNGFKKVDFSELKKKFPKDYQYYATAEKYFNSLSDKVKISFSVEELCYIYIFDQHLKNKLVNVK